MNQSILNEKVALVKQIADTLSEATSTVIVEYRGLSVAEMNELRRALRKENVEIKIFKNSMVERAVASLGHNELLEDLVGPNAIVYAKDSSAPARILSKFAKKHDKLVLKSGLVEGKFASRETIQTIANLPNKEGMLSMLLSCLQSPIRSFACVTKAVSDQKSEKENN